MNLYPYGNGFCMVTTRKMIVLCYRRFPIAAFDLRSGECFACTVTMKECAKEINGFVEAREVRPRDVQMVTSEDMETIITER